MQLAAKIRDARTSLSHLRTRRLAHRRLSAELATFVTAADRAELDHLLDRYDSDQTREIRTILLRQDAARL
ncbi:hypothetical protein DMB66_29555 [Actinoplanes sp. ATCC 53533]|uniref:hypothetical protein n=1 Tax=Actinoplanes sp. ATCC 53533 TaxID=1288362 RepID=UPI000F76D434|nr:hypothetical protein [Actinoplanes sp. ATCC 53533]RSM58415.1 hypothetical protein DMB66_29555 [Actinoplanes sp. ATCC 53533]